MTYLVSNTSSTQVITVSGRYYLDTNNLYEAWGDTRYGANYYQWNDHQTNTDVTNPIFRPIGNHVLIPENSVIKRVSISGVMSHNDIDDAEFAVVILEPTSGWGGGLNNSNVTQHNLVVGEKLTDHTTSTNLRHNNLVDLNIPSHTPTAYMSNLVVACRGVGGYTTRRYFYANIRVEYEVKT